MGEQTKVGIENGMVGFRNKQMKVYSLDTLNCINWNFCDERESKAFVVEIDVA